MARYTCVAILCGVFAVWGKYSFIDEADTPAFQPIDLRTNYKYPLMMTVGYLISLPILHYVVSNVLNVDQKYMKALLKDSMVCYNAAQVLLNGWMVYYIIDALLNKNHPFAGDTYTTLCSYAVWIHYCDKYLEFFDTYFMVLRGRMDQVSFLHVYHHFSIAWAWWIGCALFPSGDSYFGALLNSLIHVLMYSYYCLALLGISCPWKRYLTQAQLIQFFSVIVYTFYIQFGMKRKEGHDLEKIHYFAAAVQVFEMVSLFILFSLFYKKTYKKKKNQSEEDDACQAAVAEITSSAQKAVKVVEGVKKFTPDATATKKAL